MENEALVNKTEYQPSRVLSAVFEWVSAAIVALVLIVLIFAVLLRSVNVDGQSMDPTLHNGDRLIISDFMYTPEYGDIVIIRREHNTPLIKRVIGLPNDTIQIDNEHGIVIRNGEPIDEPYIKKQSSTKQGTHAVGITQALVVGENQIYVLGDNRENSHDSRADGPYSMDQLVGRVLLRVSPVFGKVE